MQARQISQQRAVQQRRAHPSCLPRTQVSRATLRVRAEARPSLQLATAKLPPQASIPRFAASLYQWAATLTQGGAKDPFVLPLQTDKLETGFKISLLRSITPGSFAAAGEIEAVVETIAGEGNVLFVRFYEGPASMNQGAKASQDAEKRLETVLNGLVDIPVIMDNMPRAIRKAARIASP